jgi:hypothetical protein
VSAHTLASVCCGGAQSLTLHLEEGTCFNLDAYASELDLWPPSAWQEETKGTPSHDDRHTEKSCENEGERERERAGRKAWA